jgi:hypothetical protein
MVFMKRFLFLIRKSIAPNDTNVKIIKTPEVSPWGSAGAVVSLAPHSLFWVPEPAFGRVDKTPDKRGCQEGESVILAAMENHINLRAMANAMIDGVDRLIANIDLSRREALQLRSDMNRILEKINHKEGSY